MVRKGFEEEMKRMADLGKEIMRGEPVFNEFFTWDKKRPEKLTKADNPDVTSIEQFAFDECNGDFPRRHQEAILERAAKKMNKRKKKGKETGSQLLSSWIKQISIASVTSMKQCIGKVIFEIESQIE